MRGFNRKFVSAFDGFVFFIVGLYSYTREEIGEEDIWFARGAAFGLVLIAIFTFIVAFAVTDVVLLLSYARAR